MTLALRRIIVFGLSNSQAKYFPPVGFKLIPKWLFFPSQRLLHSYTAPGVLWLWNKHTSLSTDQDTKKRCFHSKELQYFCCSRGALGSKRLHGLQPTLLLLPYIFSYLLEGFELPCHLLFLPCFLTRVPSLFLHFSHSAWLPLKLLFFSSTVHFFSLSLP